jgi:hypothetical protein
MNIILRTGALSLVFQGLTGLFDIYVLMQDFSPKMNIVKSLLWIELLVQTIEGMFYVWLVMNFSKITNITPFRYYDWIITTPSMLFSFSMYLIYLNLTTADKEENNDKIPTLYELTLENSPTLVTILILNTLMLLFGYLAEMGKLTVNMGALYGFVPFIAMFYLIYDNYAKYTQVGRITFYYFSGIWALYGFASLLSYKYKNTIYNILDLLSKNFFGIFLGAVLLLSNK